MLWPEELRTGDLCVVEFLLVPLLPEVWIRCIAADLCTSDQISSNRTRKHCYGVETSPLLLTDSPPISPHRDRVRAADRDPNAWASRAIPFPQHAWADSKLTARFEDTLGMCGNGKLMINDPHQKLDGEWRCLKSR